MLSRFRVTTRSAPPVFTSPVGHERVRRAMLPPNQPLRLVPVLALVLVLLSCGSRENSSRQRGRVESKPPAYQAPVDTTTAVWEPPEYWSRYRTVFLRAATDSTGHLKDARILHTYASPAETDSILRVASSIRLDPSIDDGQLYTSRSGMLPQKERDLILPFILPGNPTHPGQAISRKELERAGLAPWLSICDDVLSEWPVENWTEGGSLDLYQYPAEHHVDDKDLMALGMVSIAPQGPWRVHPFYDVGFDKQGKPAGLEADSGFVLYRTRAPYGGWQHVAGTTTSYSSAEWIDSKRFVLSGYCELDMNYESGYVRYHAPFLDIGDVDSLRVRVISGPPIPVQNVALFLKRVQDYRASRYPKYFGSTSR
jgi:hypothetical protein